jgi:hypothetical protein
MTITLTSLSLARAVNGHEVELLRFPGGDQLRQGMTQLSLVDFKSHRE